MKPKLETRVIVNPTAAAGAVAREWPDLRSYLSSQGLEFTEVYTEAPGHAVALAAEARAQGCGLVVAVGGDGTLNEVVNGLCGDSHSGAVPDLGVISRGTGCDLVRTLGLREPRQAVAALTERNTTRALDVGAIHTENDSGTRLFINAAGMGFDGEVVEGLLHARVTGRSIGGTIPYLQQVVRTVMHYDNKRLRAQIDEEVVEGLFTAIFACNGRYLGGGMQVAPEADPTDGLLEVVVIRALSRPGLLARLPVIYTGKLTIFPQVSIHRARELKLSTGDRMLIQADGELIGQAPATIRVLPGAVRVRV